MRSRIVLLALLASASAHAAGFQVLEQGAAATGMAGTFTAKADDASAIFYNPGGLAGQEGWQLYVGTTLITGSLRGDVTDVTSGAEAFPVPLPTIYASYGLDNGLTVGVGAFTQFGLKVIWPDDWSGRFVSTHASLDTITINPTVAYKVLPWLGIGAGLDITPAKVELRRQVDLVAAEATLEFEANAVAVGGNLGVMVDLPSVSIGVSYRNQTDLDFDDGLLEIDGPPELSSTLRDLRARTTLPLVDLLSMGVSVRPTEDWSIVAQVDWNNWSRVQELMLTTPVADMNITLPQNWSDGWVARLGTEVRVSKARLHAGIGYDWNPVPSDTLSPVLPDADRWLAALGASVDLNDRFTGEFSLMGVFFRDRTSDLPELQASYENFAILAGFAVSYRAFNATRR